MLKNGQKGGIEPEQYETTDTGAAMSIAVEHIARAFHAVQEDSIAWEDEPEILKEEFRRYAREALALYAEHEAQAARADISSAFSDDARAAA